MWGSLQRTELRILVIAAVTIASFPSTAFAVEEERYLSTSGDIGYLILESLQARECSERPTHDCTITYEKCAEMQRQLWLSLFKEEPPPQMVRRGCTRVSTRYEMRGMYALLSDLYADAAAAAQRLSLPMPLSPPRLGSLPVREINVRVGAPDYPGVYLVLFNIRFVEFVHEMTKIAALAIPVEVDDQDYRISLDKDAFIARLQERPELVLTFAKTILSFLDLERRQHVEPPQFIQPLLSTYDRGIESFAMGHEYGHLALSHALPDDAGAERCVWHDEVAADVIGGWIVAEIATTTLSDPSAHVLEPVLPVTPEFYFVARQILDEATELLKTGCTLAPPTEAEVVSAEWLEYILEGWDRGTPDKTLRLKEAVQGLPVDRDRCPHPAIRRRIANAAVKRDTDAEAREEAFALARLVVRNELYLWSIVTEAFERFGGPRMESK